MNEKNNTLLIWDIENISFKNYREIFSKINYKPEKIIVASKKEVGLRQKKFFEENNIKLVNCNRIADDVIIDIINIYKKRMEEINIVSSDNDFSNIVNNLLKEKTKVNWIIENRNQKRILMANDLTNKYLNFLIINDILNVKSKKDKVTPPTKRSKKKKEEKELKKIPKSKYLIKAEKRMEEIKNRNVKKKVETKPIKNLKKVKPNNQLEIQEKYKKGKLWLKKELESIKKDLSNNFLTIDVCQYCGNEDYIFREEEKTCEKCHKLKMYELEKEKKKNPLFLKETTHEERMMKFKNRREKEIEMYGQINYKKSEEINLYHLKLQKIKIPPEYKTLSLEEDKNNIYYQELGI